MDVQAIKHARVFASGLSLRDVNGGREADADLAHIIRYFEEMEIALDAFEEDVANIERVSREISESPRIFNDAHEHIIVPNGYFEWRYYLVLRQMAHGRLFVLALWQVINALDHFQGLVGLAAANTALADFESAFPGLNGLRNAIAHAAERARRPLKVMPGEPLKLSSLLARHGHCDGSDFVMDPGKDGEVEVRVAVNLESLERVRFILQTLADELPWVAGPAEKYQMRAWL